MKTKGKQLTQSKKRTNTKSKKQNIFKKGTRRSTKNMRTVDLRLTLSNIIHMDNKKFGIKAGDIFEYTVDGVVKILEKWKSTKKSLHYFLILHDKDTSNPHIHVVITFGHSVCDFSTLKNKFPYGEISSCKSVKKCVQYLVHMNHPEKYQYSWDEVITDSPSELEKYKNPDKYTVNTILEYILNQIIEGKIREYEITSKIDHDIFIKYATKIERAFEYRRIKILNDPKRDVQVIVIVGPSGAGKTTFVKEYAKKYGKSVCFSASGKNFMDDYHGEDILCLDDYDFENLNVNDCKKLIDPFTNAPVARRYHNGLFIGDTIFIVTNSNITQLYIAEKDYDRMAVFRRISAVFEFQELSDDFIAKYTIKRVIIDTTLTTEVNPYGEVINLTFTRIKLEPIDYNIYTFDLKKCFSIESRQNNTEKLISQLTDM